MYRNRPDLDTKPETWVRSFEHRLLGIDFGHLPSFAPVLAVDRSTPVDPPQWAEQNSGMAAVIPAWRLQTMLLDDQDIIRDREAGEAEWIKRQGGGSSRSKEGANEQPVR